MFLPLDKMIKGTGSLKATVVRFSEADALGVSCVCMRDGGLFADLSGSCGTV